MKYVVPIDESAFAGDKTSVVLAGPDTGLDSCKVVCWRTAPGHRGLESHTHSVDQFYFILKGKLDVEIGNETFEVGPDTLIHFPAGTPHCSWNSSAEDEMHLEIYAPAPKENDVRSSLPRPIANAQSFIHKIEPGGYEEGPFAVHELVMRKTGSEHLRLYCAKVAPGAGGPPLHFHKFDQLYFILEGSFEVTIGLDKLNAPALSLVVLPAAILHTNRNNAATTERHLAMIIPEPKAGEPLDYIVTVSDKEFGGLDGLFTCRLRQDGVAAS